MTLLGFLLSVNSDDKLVKEEAGWNTVSLINFFFFGMPEALGWIPSTI